MLSIGWLKEERPTKSMRQRESKRNNSYIVTKYHSESICTQLNVSYFVL